MIFVRNHHFVVPLVVLSRKNCLHCKCSVGCLVASDDGVRHWRSANRIAAVVVVVVVVVPYVVVVP